jgi:regulator of sigma E protease
MIATAILALIIAFLVLIILMIIHEFGHFIVAKKFGVRVDEFGIGYPPRMFGKKFGDTIYSINWIPLGAFVRIYGEEGEGDVDDYRSFIGLEIWKRVLIVLGGVIAFWLAAMVIFSVVFAIGASLPISDQDTTGLSNPRIVIIGIEANSPASAAGLKSGDVIQSVEIDQTTQNVTKIADFQAITQQNAGKPITLYVERNHQFFETDVTPRVTAPAGQGLVGVQLERVATLVQQYAWYAAPIKGIEYTFQATWSTLVGLYQTIADLAAPKHQLPAGAEFAGPVGITIFLANAASYGPGFFLYFIGLISVILAIFNLLPIPALDGGKLLFLLIEKIKGKPVSAAIESRISIACFIILISLSLFITIHFDIPRLLDYFKAGF